VSKFINIVCFANHFVYKPTNAYNNFLTYLTCSQVTTCKLCNRKFIADQTSKSKKVTEEILIWLRVDLLRFCTRDGCCTDRSLQRAVWCRDAAVEI